MPHTIAVLTTCHVGQASGEFGLSDSHSYLSWTSGQVLVSSPDFHVAARGYLPPDSFQSHQGNDI